MKLQGDAWLLAEQIRCASQAANIQTTVAKPIQGPPPTPKGLPSDQQDVSATAPAPASASGGVGEIKINDPSARTPYFIGPARLPIDLMDAIHEIKVREIVSQGGLVTI